MNTDKIPTAEEFMNSFPFGKKLTTQDLMIEFAKLHVKAALEAAVKKADVVEIREDGYPVWSIVDTSILNAYPEENIK